MVFVGENRERETAHARFVRAVTEDDIATLNVIDMKYPGFAATMAPAFAARDEDNSDASMPMTALAASQGRVHSLRWLLSRGGQLHGYCTVIGATPLYHAVMQRQLATARMLLQAGADPQDGKRAAGRTGVKTPLQYAEEYGSGAMIALLEEFSAAKAPPLPPAPPPRTHQRASGRRYRL